MDYNRIIEQEIIRRRDMREVFTFTIDPSDAKDFDDALSIARNEDGTWQVGIHIADVSFFVRPGSKEDDEAYKRGTSVYLVDRVLPMLPERLCNELCSLQPNQDKLCMSVVFTMTDEAEVLKHKICRTIIRSDVRLDYEEAFAMIHGGKQIGSQLAESLLTLNWMAIKLRAKRLAHGALAIEQDEVRFRLDENAFPEEIYFVKPNEAHHLIEEFMLLANRTVAESICKKPFVYRIHDKPNSDKLEEMEHLKKKMGHRLQQQVIDLLTIRAQAKAIYSTHNIGHYGLAFSHYTHFTSPIRRYPDLMVHRLVERYILTGKGPTVNREELEIMCEHCSECEQEAQQAERDSIKMFQTMWMERHLGEVFDGHISGITDFGFFVQLDENHCEGLIHMYCIEHPEDYVLGDSVRVQVVRVDTNRSQIDLEFA